MSDQENYKFQEKSLSPKSWFLLGQSLLNVAQNYLRPDEDRSFANLTSMYLNSLNLAATKFEECLKAIKSLKNFKDYENIMAECYTALGFIFLVQSSQIKDLKTKQYKLQKSYNYSKQSFELSCNSSIYNILCVESLNNSKDTQKLIQICVKNGAFPPLVHVFYDKDLNFLKQKQSFDNLYPQIYSNPLIFDFSWLYLENETDKVSTYKKNQDNLSLTTDSFLLDEDANKLQASLIREGFSKSTVNFMLKQVLTEKKIQTVKSENYESAQIRLLERINFAGMKQKSVIPGDGNCQFHSLSDQIFDNIQQTHWIRNRIVLWLREHGNWILPENGARLQDFVADDWDTYCNSMSKNGTWGDHLTLIAATYVFGVRIVLFSSIDDNNYVTEYIPSIIKSSKILFVCHYAEYHYGSLTRQDKN